MFWNMLFENLTKMAILSRCAGNSPKRRCQREQANQFLAIQDRYQHTSHPRPSLLAPLVVATFPSLPVPLEQRAQSPLSLTLWGCLMRTSENSRSACFHLPPKSETLSTFHSPCNQPLITGRSVLCIQERPRSSFLMRAL